MKSLYLLPHTSVVLPGGQLRLKICEQRHMTMVIAHARNDEGFGVCLTNSETEDQAKELFTHGTMVKIVDWDSDDNGQLDVFVQGIQQFRVVDSSVGADGLLNGGVELQLPEQKTAIPSQYRELSLMLYRAIEKSGLLYECPDMNINDAVWVSNRLVELLPMSSVELRYLIALSDPIKQLSILLPITRELILKQNFAGTDQKTA